MFPRKETRLPRKEIRREARGPGRARIHGDRVLDVQLWGWPGCGKRLRSMEGTF